jgi:hypothetical protein
MDWRYHGQGRQREQSRNCRFFPHAVKKTESTGHSSSKTGDTACPGKESESHVLASEHQPPPGVERAMAEWLS